MLYVLLFIILFLIIKSKKESKFIKILKFIIPVCLCVLLISDIKGCIKQDTVTDNPQSIDTSNITVDVGYYNELSIPIGIGEYYFRKGDYEERMYLNIEATKNSSSPWCGAIIGEIEFFDENNNSLGKDVDKISTLREGMQSTLMYGFSIADGKVVYNQKEITKIVLTSLYEEDDLHNFLKSNFNNKERELNNCIDSGDFELFYTKLLSAREEYPREEFPDENVVFDEMENKVAKRSSYTPIATDKAEDTPKKTEQPQTDNAKVESTTAKEIIPPKSYKDQCHYISADNLLQSISSYKGEPICVNGTISTELSLNKSKIQADSCVLLADSTGIIVIAYDKSVVGGHLQIGDMINVYGECIGSIEVLSNVKAPIVKFRYSEYPFKNN